ncbi:MAG: serpin family protein [Candidatus Bathyarchaeota archaeon]|nr:serpin family protein [Candidatus Bathyarchaeota archaeon]
MKSSRRRLLVGVVLLLIMGGAGFLINYLSAGMVYAESDAAAANVDASIVAANTGFAMRLLTELQREQGGKNIFISPLSVSIALSMTYNGANSTTKAAMREALGISGMSDEAVNAGFKQLIESLANADRDVALNIGDSVWIKADFAGGVKKNFIDTLSKYYLSEVYTRPFDPTTVSEVNSWVSKETNGKISKILDKIDADNVMFLINAIYFKGDWVDKFDESLTRPADFTTADGSTVTVDMMSRGGRYGYYGDSVVQIARLPYGRDKIAMYVFLPAEGSSLDSFTAGLTGEKFGSYFAKLSQRELDLRMPKLKLEYGKVDLKPALTSLGMGIAFDPSSADFSKIADVAPERLYIAFVDHKAVVEINEKGTEAAAATNVGISVTSAPMRTSFTVNRPYMFVIRDDRSGTILFSGLITDPTIETSP